MLKMTLCLPLPGFCVLALPSPNLESRFVIPVNSNCRPYVSRKQRYNVISMVHGKEEEDPTLLRLSRRRLILATVTALGISFGGNLFGITSLVLSTLPREALLGLDQVYPVNGMKRYVQAGDFEFVYPKEWVQDTAVAYFKQTMNAKKLDYSMRDKGIASAPIPDAALGPGGGDGRENISVIKSGVLPGFSMETTLGPPQDAAEKLLSTTIAPPGSNKQATLIRAVERETDGSYVFEFVVKGTDSKGRAFEAHNLSVIAFRPRDNSLFTMTALCRQADWQGRRLMLTQAADSFRIVQ